MSENSKWLSGLLLFGVASSIISIQSHLVDTITSNGSYQPQDPGHLRHLKESNRTTLTVPAKRTWPEGRGYLVSLIKESLFEWLVKTNK